MHDAISNGRLACVRLLVTRGANPLAANANGITALQLAEQMLMLPPPSLPSTEVNASASRSGIGQQRKRQRERLAISTGKVGSLIEIRDLLADAANNVGHVFMPLNRLSSHTQ
ncbi:unnamed protein product [Protopolystoma xenopodis]|uniref:Uncharacterized protein n=1 Tax=Protopolystoma xenopodis TaxID=117903 RepID=A0A3S5AJI8_9PLAT|nr:unnamed protein product [Protopolystoma xenopodis]